MSLKDKLMKNSQENSREIIEKRKEKESFEKILNIIYGEIVESLEWNSKNGYTTETFELGGMITDFIEKLECDEMYEYCDDFYYDSDECNDEEILKQEGIAKIKKKYFTYESYAPWNSAWVNNRNLCVFKNPDKIIDFFKSKLKEDDLLECATFTKEDEIEIREGYYEYRKTEGFLDFLIDGEERRIKRRRTLGKGYCRIRLKVTWG